MSELSNEQSKHDIRELVKNTIFNKYLYFTQVSAQILEIAPSSQPMFRIK